MHRRMAGIGVAACVVALAVGGRLLAQEEEAKPESFVNREGEVIDGVVVDGVLVDRSTGGVVEGVPVPGPSVTPPGDGVPRPDRPSFTVGPGDPTRFRQMMLAQMKQRLGIDDQAWKVIEPRLAKVLDLNRQLPAGLSMLGTLGGGPGGPIVVRGAGPRTSGMPANATAQVQTVRANPAARESYPQGEPTALGKAIAQLRTTLANPSAPPEDIKKQLTAVRAARERARQELTAAQEDLKRILTVQQEAQLVLMGQLN